MTTKVMFLPLNYGDVVQEGVYDAFRQNGCELQVFDYFAEMNRIHNQKRLRSHFIERAIAFEPDLLHMQIQHTTIIDSKTVAVVKDRLPNTIITNWTGDVRNYVPMPYRRIATVADFNLISSTGQIALFKGTIKKDVKFWQIGYNPRLYYPSPVERTHFDYDAVFTGHYNNKEKYPCTQQRIDTCKLLRRAFGSRFVLFGANWPRDVGSKGSLDQKSLSKLYHRSLCTVSVNHYHDLGHYFSDRLLMCMASGRPTVSLYFPNYESYFTDGCDLLIAHSPQEVVDKVRYLKNNPRMAEFIGKQGAAKVFAEHTYASRIKELLSLVGLRNA